MSISSMQLIVSSSTVDCLLPGAACTPVIQLRCDHHTRQTHVDGKTRCYRVGCTCSIPAASSRPLPPSVRLVGKQVVVAHV